MTFKSHLKWNHTHWNGVENDIWYFSLAQVDFNISYYYIFICQWEMKRNSHASQNTWKSKPQTNEKRDKKNNNKCSNVKIYSFKVWILKIENTSTMKKLRIILKSGKLDVCITAIYFLQ